MTYTSVIISIILTDIILSLLVLKGDMNSADACVMTCGA